jgi:hypothetical protein
MSIIRERVTRAAESAIVQSQLTGYGTAWAAERAGWFFDVARRADADEHQAAFIALDEFGEFLVKHYTPIAECLGSAPNECQRARMYIQAGVLMKGYARGFATEGQLAVFDRYVAEAESAA